MIDKMICPMISVLHEKGRSVIRYDGFALVRQRTFITLFVVKASSRDSFQDIFIFALEYFIKLYEERFYAIKMVNE